MTQHSKRVEKIENYTRNEWRRWYFSPSSNSTSFLTNLKEKLSSEKMKTVNKWHQMGEELKEYLDEQRSKHIFSTRLECIFTSFPLVPSVFLHLFTSFRVYFYVVSTRCECRTRCFQPNRCRNRFK